MKTEKGGAGASVRGADAGQGAPAGGADGWSMLEKMDKEK
jgi:hypothetical protein